MTAPALLAELATRDIRVRLDGDQLRLDAPSGALTAELRDQLRTRRDELLDFLRRADALAHQAESVVPIQPGGTRTPIFAVPGHSGDVFCYRALSRHLGPDQPLFGLRPPGLDGERAPLDSVPALAAHFAAQLRTVHGDAPCVIAGFCAGGTVAYELARQLRAAGTDVRAVVLIGAPFPTYFRRAVQLRERTTERLARLRGHVGRMARESWRERWRHVVERRQRVHAKQVAARQAGADPIAARRIRLEQVTLAAVRHFRPRATELPLVLVYPDARWPRTLTRGRKWGRLSRNVTVLAGPVGTTGDEMLREPHVRRFAELLRTSGAPA